jgi:hypothetical protein
MSKLNLRNKIGNGYDRARLEELLGKIEEQVNQLSEGRIGPRYAARTAVPTTGDFQVGDVIWNSAPAELGSASSMYVIIGWVNVTAGSPGTWKQMRMLTGN